jgi:hypothetical protein
MTHPLSRTLAIPAHLRCLALLSHRRQTFFELPAAPPSLADIESALICHSEDQLCDCYSALLQIHTKYDSPPDAVLRAAVADALAPDSPYANLALAFLARSSEMIHAFLSEVNWPLLRGICEWNISDSVFPYLTTFFQIPETHRPSYENGLFHALGDSHPTFCDDDPIHIERNLSLLSTIASSAFELPGPAIDTLAARLTSLFGSGAAIPESAQPFFIRFIYDSFRLSNSDRILAFLNCPSHLCDFVFSWNSSNASENCLLIGLLLCELTAAAGFPGIGAALERRRIHRYIARHLFSPSPEASCACFCALTNFVEVFPASIFDLALAQIADAFSDAPFRVKTAAGVFFASVCRHSAALGLVDWIAERGIVSELLRVVGGGANDGIREFVLSAVVEVLSDGKVILTPDDVEVLSAIDHALARLAIERGSNE